MDDSPRQAETPRAEPPIGFWPVLVGLFGMLTCSVIFVLIAGGGDPTHHDLTLRTVLVGLSGTWAGMALGIALASDFSFKGLVERLGLRIRRVDIPVGIAIGVACQIVLVWLVYLPVKLLSPEAYRHVSDSAKELTGVATGWGVVPFVAGICVIAPIFEELFFRGVMLRALSRAWGTAAGVILSSLCFALIHFEKWETLALGVFGLVLALIALRTNRLGMNIVAHMAFNSVTVFILLVIQ